MKINLVHDQMVVSSSPTHDKSSFIQNGPTNSNWVTFCDVVTDLIKGRAKWGL